VPATLNRVTAAKRPRTEQRQFLLITICISM
jgi:hypothetical protein